MKKDKNTQIRTRFAPSPTGYVHIGNLRTALFAYLIAKKYDGKFLLRIEDTDQKRLVEDSVEKIFKALKWVGIEIDEGAYDIKDGEIKEKGKLGPYVQSKRLEIYRGYAEKLIQEGKAYYCFCASERLKNLRERQQKNKQAPMYDKHCRGISLEEAKERIKAGEAHTVRMKVPENKKVEFTDLVYGKISVSSNIIDDQVLIKSDGFPTYHLAVVVDDYLMKISHIVRGEDWIPSAPKHILLYEYFGWDLPVFIHLPNVLGENHKKLSKRQGDVSVNDFRQKGYLPETIVNFLALLGWNPKTDDEIFSMEELIKKFDERGLHKAGAIFNYKKFDWMNSYYIKQKSEQDLFQLCLPYFEKFEKERGIKIMDEMKEKIITIEKRRMRKLSEITENVDLYFSAADYGKQLLVWKDMTEKDVKKALEKMKETIIGIEDFADLKNIEDILIKSAGEARGQHLWPLRVALTGKEKSPSPFEIAWAIGKEETIKRIDAAINKLKQ
ncbi:MAG: glutamate--tRNA ligase [Candidatus Moranbacteria bacterium]|jgi:nondiscriminating glutamyl-tRNA synthetase|nr:glutamate--tRNA ligase [Candidatus Moranbacteria bacterium]